MHRHGYQGRKLGRERDQRRALIKGLADSLIKYESIETTLPKAKEIVPYVERLITKAKKGDLHARRQIISSLQTIESAHKLVDDIAPKLGARNSGHLRIVKSGFRRGDHAAMAKVSFVDDLKQAPVSKAAEKEAKPAVTKPAARSTAKPAAKTLRGKK
ncbi:MAG: rplQ [Candidatus Saccharibacteria bacterium]|nr:rplQ [Candidatus Saccharibacteria bacterium]